MVLAPVVKSDFADAPPINVDSTVLATHMNAVAALLNQLRTILVPWETKAVPAGVVVGTTDGQTLTGKTVALGVNTVSGTTAQFNAANTDGDFATLAGNETLTGKTLINPTVNSYTEGVVAIGNTGTAKTIDITAGTVQTATLTGNCTFTMPSVAAGKSFVLYLKTGAGGFTATFTGVKWPAAGAPTITATAAKMDQLAFNSDGTNWYGSYIQGYTP